jgi:hypothetical protein
MQVTSIPEIFQMAPDLPVLCLRAKIKTVYKARASKPGAAKAYHFQDLIGVDERGTEIKITLSDHPPMERSIVGQTYYFQCKQSDKHGWVGVKTKDDDYNNKITRVVWVTGSAIIQPQDQNEPPQAPAYYPPTQGQAAPAQNFPYGQDPNQPPPQQQAPPQGYQNTVKGPQQPYTPPAAQQPPPQQAPPPQNAPQGQTNQQIAAMRNDAIVKTKRFYGAKATGIILALDTVVFIADTHSKRHPGKQLTMDQMQAICSTLVISADRCGILDDLPVTLSDDGGVWLHLPEPKKAQTQTNQ